MNNIILLCIGCFSFILSLILYYKVRSIKTIKDQELNNQQIKIQEFQQQIINLEKQYNVLKDGVLLKQNEKQYVQREIHYSREELKHINQEIQQTKSTIDKQYDIETKLVQKRLEDFKQISKQAAEQYIDNLEQDYKNAEAAHTQNITKLEEEYNSTAASLTQLKETRKAAYEALLKEQEIKENKDNYRLDIYYQDLNDIHSLEKIKPSFNKPRVLSMLIWQYYWQPIAKKKFPIILQDKTKTGIYKITNILTNQCYIGQSVDIYKRWCDHCKAGIGIDTPVGNKLYQAIKEDGLENFTFELLCECSKQELDEKEAYFIDLYQADLYGYNSTVGNKK